MPRRTTEYKFPTGVTLLHKDEPIVAEPVEIDTSNPKLNAWRAVREHWKTCNFSNRATCPTLLRLEAKAKKAKDTDNAVSTTD